MTDRITLKNIKHSAFASEETFCYQASLYFDNKKIGTVYNDGHGGCDYQYIDDARGWSELQAHVETLPDVQTDLPSLDKDTPAEHFSYPQSIEGICHELVADWLTSRDLKKLLAKRVLFKKKSQGGLRQTQCAKNKAVLAHWIDQIAVEDDTAEVLNLLPFDKAREIYVTEG